MATAWADGASGTIDAVPAQISSGATPTIGNAYAVGKRAASAVAHEEIAAIGREEAGTGQQLGVDNSWNPKRKIPMSIQAKSGVHRSTIWRRVQKLLSLGWSVEDAKKAAMKGVTIIVGNERKRHRIAHSSDEDEEDYEDEDNVEGMDNDEEEDDDEDAHETDEQAGCGRGARPFAASRLKTGTGTESPRGLGKLRTPTKQPKAPTPVLSEAGANVSPCQRGPESTVGATASDPRHASRSNQMPLGATTSDPRHASRSNQMPLGPTTSDSRHASRSNEISLTELHSAIPLLTSYEWTTGVRTPPRASSRLLAPPRASSGLLAPGGSASP